MSIPNWDNTFLSSLWVYRKLRGGKWYHRYYPSLKTFGYSRYGGKSPYSYVVEPFISGLGGTLLSGKW